MIRMLGQGALYRVHHEKVEWLTRQEKRRAVRLAFCIVTVSTLGVLIWIFG